MNIYKIAQDKVYGYDTYDSAIVVAESEEEAALMYPGGGEDIRTVGSTDFSGWVNDPEDVLVKLVGTTTTEPKGVLLASFNAG